MAAKRMVFLTRRQISLMGFFRRVKKTQPNRFVVDFNFRQPAFILSPYTCVAAFVAAASLAVMRVFNVGGFTQIYKTVIRAVAIYVVDLVRRPFTCHVKPRQPMREMQRVVQANNVVSVFHPATSLAAGRTFSPFCVPSKDASFGVVVYKMAKTIYRNLCLHDTVNINNWRECQQ